MLPFGGLLLLRCEQQKNANHTQPNWGTVTLDNVFHVDSLAHMQSSGDRGSRRIAWRGGSRPASSLPMLLPAIPSVEQVGESIVADARNRMDHR
jgi:hypothetical protein